MPNPIPYQNLMDMDGLKMAIKEAEAESDRFGTAATEDFKRVNSVVKSLRKELEALGVTMAKPIKLMDDAGQEQIRQLSQQVNNLTAQYNTQKAAIESVNRLLADNKKAVSDAKVQAAQYEAQLKQERVTTQQVRTEIGQTTLAMRQLSLANQQARQAQTAATGSYKEAQQQLRALGDSIRNTANGFRSTSPAIQAQIKEYNALNDKLKAFDAQMGNHQRNVGNYKSALVGIGDQLKTLALGYVSIQAAIALAGQSFSVALSTDAIKTSLEFTLKSADAANDKLKDLKATANRLGLDFIPLAKSYSMFAGAAMAANFPLDQTNKIFNSIAGAAARFHLTSDQLTGSLLAIQQMISKGTVQSEELRGQLGERLPGAFSIAARAMGVTEKELGKMLETGQVLASDLLPKLAIELDKTFSLDANTKIDSLTASTNRLKTAFDSALQGDGIGKIFQQIVDGSTAAIQSIDKLIKSRSWGEFFARVTDLNASDKYDKINSIQDNYTDSRASRSGYNPIGASSSVLISSMTSKSLAELEALRQKYLTAANQAAVAVNTYRKGISTGLISDGGKFALSEVENNFTAVQKILKDVNTAYAIVLAKTPQAQKTIKELSDDQLTSIEAIRKRITELSKLPGSAIDGSAINNRIDALKLRLKELTGSLKEAKQGFALFEEQLNKVALQLQIAIISDYNKNQGKETENTKKLADAYISLTDKIKKLKEAQDEAQKSAQRRADYNNRANNPVLSAAGSSTIDAGGLASSLTHSALIKELDDTQAWLNKIQDAYSNTNANIFNEYKNRKITLAQYNEQIQVAQDSAADDIFDQEKKAAELRLDLAKMEYGKGSKEYRSALKALGELQDKYNKDSLQRDERFIKAQQQLRNELIGVLQSSAQTIARITGSSGLGNLFGDISTDLVNGFGKGPEQFQNIANLGMDAIATFTDFSINASNARIEQLNKEREHDLSLAGNNNEAKMKIEEEYNKRITEEKRKQATLQKAAAIADIAINTAVAVTKVAAVTGPLAFLLAPAIIALGAIQAGIVLATPLPQYEKGRAGGNAEFAEVNERGPELIGQKGKWRLANRGMRGVTYLNQGDQVKTATDTKQMMANGMITADGQYVTNVSQSKSIYDQYIMATNKASEIDYNRMAGAFSDGVSGLPVTEHNYNENGYQKNLRVKNTRMLNINRRNQF